jgi:hypothetical protein
MWGYRVNRSDSNCVLAKHKSEALFKHQPTHTLPFLKSLKCNSPCLLTFMHRKKNTTTFFSLLRLGVGFDYYFLRPQQFGSTVIQADRSSTKCHVAPLWPRCLDRERWPWGIRPATVYTAWNSNLPPQQGWKGYIYFCALRLWWSHSPLVHLAKCRRNPNTTKLFGL